LLEQSPPLIFVSWDPLLSVSRFALRPACKFVFRLICYLLNRTVYFKKLKNVWWPVNLWQHAFYLYSIHSMLFTYIASGNKQTKYFRSLVCADILNFNWLSSKTRKSESAAFREPWLCFVNRNVSFELFREDELPGLFSFVGGSVFFSEVLV